MKEVIHFYTTIRNIIMRVDIRIVGSDFLLGKINLRKSMNWICVCVRRENNEKVARGNTESQMRELVFYNLLKKKESNTTLKVYNLRIKSVMNCSSRLVKKDNGNKRGAA